MQNTNIVKVSEGKGLFMPPLAMKYSLTTCSPLTKTHKNGKLNGLCASAKTRPPAYMTR